MPLKNFLKKISLSGFVRYQTGYDIETPQNIEWILILQRFPTVTHTFPNIAQQ